MPRLCHCLLIWASLPGTYPDKLVSCLFVSCPSLHLQAARDTLPWTRPGRLSALSSCNSLAPFLPTGGCWDVNPPSNSGSLSRCLPVRAMSGWQAELEVAELWRARWPLVHGGGCPWGVHGQCTPGRRTIPLSSRPR